MDAASSRAGVARTSDPADNAAHRAIFTTGSIAVILRSTESDCVANIFNREGNPARTATAS
ncbi:Uncharacterised protein [Mycobacteroides abscessus subsp. abscessus]|nr:Uncharacterised protein [Mycobacteroides abscessus subsp. abscessus]